MNKGIVCANLRESGKIPVENEVLIKLQMQFTSELRHSINKFTGIELTFCLDFLRLQIINKHSDGRTGDKNKDEALLNLTNEIGSTLLGGKFSSSSRPMSQKYLLNTFEISKSSTNT